MSKQTTLIVGAHFRPPAKQLLAVLSNGHPLRLEEDNENQYDAAAVRVMLDLVKPDGTTVFTEAQCQELEAELPNCGMSLEQLVSGGPVQLGFVPAQEGKPLQKARVQEPELLGNLQVREIMASQRDGEVEANYTLGFGIDGNPRLEIETSESKGVPDHAIEDAVPQQ